MLSSSLPLGQSEGATIECAPPCTKHASDSDRHAAEVHQPRGRPPISLQGFRWRGMDPHAGSGGAPPQRTASQDIAMPHARTGHLLSAVAHEAAGLRGLGRSSAAMRRLIRRQACEVPSGGAPHRRRRDRFPPAADSPLDDAPLLLHLASRLLAARHFQLPLASNVGLATARREPSALILIPVWLPGPPGRMASPWRWC